MEHSYKQLLDTGLQQKVFTTVSVLVVTVKRIAYNKVIQPENQTVHVYHTLLSHWSSGIGVPMPELWWVSW